MQVGEQPQLRGKYITAEGKARQGKKCVIIDGLVLLRSATKNLLGPHQGEKQCTRWTVSKPH